jgi:hypothetical protein
MASLESQPSGTLLILSQNGKHPKKNYLQEKIIVNTLHQWGIFPVDAIFYFTLFSKIIKKSLRYMKYYIPKKMSHTRIIQIQYQSDGTDIFQQKELIARKFRKR